MSDKINDDVNPMIQCNVCSLEQPIAEVPEDETVSLCDYHQARVEYAFSKMADAMNKITGDLDL